MCIRMQCGWLLTASELTNRCVWNEKAAMLAEMGTGDSPSGQREFTAPLSVNEALAQGRLSRGAYVYVTGLLSWEFEHRSVHHWPRADARDFGFWLEPSWPVFSFDEATLSRWHNKRVVVGGQLIMGDGDSGCGHMGVWPGKIRVSSLVLLKSWNRAHPKSAPAT